jgi:hypothetical protein
MVINCINTEINHYKQCAYYIIHNTQLKIKIYFKKTEKLFWYT